MYGQNTDVLRESLRELLTFHRIQHRIGGAGPRHVPATTTAEERRLIGEQIARYRHSVLTWCHQGLYAANPHIDHQKLTRRTRGPAEDLRHRIHAALAADHAGLPTLTELTTTQPFRLVELWRQASRACALGEHDFTAGAGHGRLSKAQALTLVHDIAEVTEALTALDRRYDGVPGWQHLTNKTRLARAAQACATYSRYSDPSYSIDHHGWDAPAQLIEGPGLPGLAGVVQAQHNLLVHLGTIPNAHSLRVILDSQRCLSHEAATRLTDRDPDRAARWAHRGQVYGSLVRQTRDIGGNLGTGGLAAGQGSIAAARMRKLPHDALNDPTQARQLERISACIDQRVADALRYGITKRLYLQRANVLGLQDRDGTLEHVIRKRFIPMTGPLKATLIDLARNQLRPEPVRRDLPRPGAAESRIDFQAALHHRRGDTRPSQTL
ncbi:hypothetical protein GA707_07745 [Nostocoides sp. F2B08]|uniref:hypothetical protein n=1 Tax=Nostocoides sp. F2B08 TaxID=2653936 RepID=UPI0012636F4E|nr:hypothetical protein [Tetrasphaera sp. F2B08]KAB7744500.1 hypothetical protein GA707_07745 [Tetrasphaera sp. F2B08]